MCALIRLKRTSTQRMPRAYRPLLPLWYYQERLRLSDRYPSGLEWAIKTARYEVGDMAGKWTGKYYVLRIGGDTFHAHRVVYYMRTGTNPGNSDVVHGADNPEKDNRKEMVLYLREQNPKRERKTMWRHDGNFEKELKKTNGKPQLQAY